MSKFIRIALLTVLAGIVVFNSLACNTIKGAGKDVEETGDAIQKAADNAK